MWDFIHCGILIFSSGISHIVFFKGLCLWTGLFQVTLLIRPRLLPKIKHKKCMSWNILLLSTRPNSISPKTFNHTWSLLSRSLSWQRPSVSLLCCLAQEADPDVEQYGVKVLEMLTQTHVPCWLINALKSNVIQSQEWMHAIFWRINVISGWVPVRINEVGDSQKTSFMKTKPKNHDSIP